MSFKSPFNLKFAAGVAIRGTVFSQSPRSFPQLPTHLGMIRSARALTTSIRGSSFRCRLPTLAERMSKVAFTPRCPIQPMGRMLFQRDTIYPVPCPALHPIQNLSLPVQADCSPIDPTEPENVDCSDLYGNLEEFEQSGEIDSSESLPTLVPDSEPTSPPEPSSNSSSELDQEPSEPAREDVLGERNDLGDSTIDDWMSDPKTAALFADASIKL